MKEFNMQNKRNASRTSDNAPRIQAHVFRTSWPALYGSVRIVVTIACVAIGVSWARTDRAMANDYPVNISLGHTGASDVMCVGNSTLNLTATVTRQDNG